MNLQSKIVTLLVCTLVSAIAFAQTPEVSEKAANYSPYFAKVGRTIFVSGSGSRWYGRLMAALPSVGNEAAMRAYSGDPSKQIDLVVFVNATSPNPEETRGSYSLIARLKGHAVSTKIVGECDMFCARLFIAGKTREFGQDLDGEPARLKIQVPVDLEKKSIERRFPNTQIAVYERYLPEFAEKHRELLLRGFTHPVDTTGGVFISPNDVKYCATLKTVECENFTGLNAFNMGLTTSSQRSPMVLPERFPAPVATGYAAIDDMKKVPFKEEKTLAKYERFLRAPKIDDKAFAFSDNEGTEVSISAWGLKGGEDAAGSALRLCEEMAKVRCRLYASGSDVVW